MGAELPWLKLGEGDQWLMFLFAVSLIGLRADRVKSEDRHEGRKGLWRGSRARLRAMFIRSNDRGWAIEPGFF